MIDKPSLLDTPNLINGKEYTVSPIPGASVDDCYAKDSLIRGDYDGSDTNEWDVGKLVQETLPAAEWDAWIHDLTGFGWQMTEVVRSIWEEIYCLINGAQAGMAQQAITQLLSGAQTFTNKTISFNSNTLTNVASLDTAQTLTNKTIAFGSNTLTDVASTNTTQTLTGKTLDLNLDTNKIYVDTASRALASDSNKKVIVSTCTSTELSYVHGVTSAIQTQLDGKQATITGAATSITGSNLTASKALMSDSSGKVAASSVTSTELGYVSGVTSAIQTQINGKQATITGAATTITGSNLTANKALISDGSGKVAVSSVTSTELGYVSGVTSAIQTQLNGKQAAGSYVPTTRTVNGKALSADISLTASDVGAISSHQTIKNQNITGATINAYVACSTAAATAAKTGNITTGTFALDTGSRVFVKFANANTANNPTLNINSKGAKNIFSNGAQITTGSNKGLLKGICEFLYDGTQWHLVGNYIDTDTKNTAGSTDTSSKIFLVGATSQAANPQTYSHDTVFVDTSGQLNSANPAAATNSTVVATTKWVTDKGYTTQGHRYAGGGANYVHVDYSLTTSTPANWYCNNDGIFCVNVAKQSTGGSITIKINDVISAYWDGRTGSGQIQGTVQLPVKNGDYIEILCNSGTWNLITYIYLYRS